MGTLSISHIFILLVLLTMIIGVAAFVFALIKASGSGSRPVSPPPNAMAPGWYPDHADPRLLRWFDGRQWTAQTQPRR
ncbi:DUF2510 domain-containing protein [Nocardia cyriacigeorgica]|uniref:DUF2510 domain-containing protein n=1 Tax=Nocardia cyriacigeorgica TaxID=135487 RepID=UPI002455A79F|nr:DUF2510 domain-containing protein [Nocardia cyriacigeorgica]